MNSTIIKNYKLLTALLIMPLSVYANNSGKEYHFETNASYARDENTSLDSNNWQAALKYYWNPITYSNNYPNKEVEFVNRLGFVGVQYQGSEGNNQRVDAFANGVDVGVRYAEKDSNHVFEFAYSWTNETIEYGRSLSPSYFLDVIGGYENYFSRDLDLDRHSIIFSYDYYLLDNLTIGAGVDVDIYDNGSTEDYSSVYHLNTYYLLNVAEQQWLAFSAEYAYVHENNYVFGSGHIFEASVEYYFTPKTSLKLGGDISFFDYEDDIENINLQWSHYVVDQFSVYAGFGYKFIRSENAQRYNVGISYRF